MLRFISRRLLTAIPVLLGVVILVFVLARVIPGDPCRAALGERATNQACDAYTKREGLDEPIPVQLVKYLGNVLRGDLGVSVSQRRPVSDILIERLPTTIELSLAALGIAIVVGVPLGVLAARKRNSATDVVTMVGANIGVSIPVFWLGLMLQFLFAVTLKNTVFALPPSGRLTPGAIPPPFYETWGLSGNGVLDFLSNFVLLNAVLQWRWDIYWGGFKLSSRKRNRD